MCFPQCQLTVCRRVPFWSRRRGWYFNGTYPCPWSGRCRRLVDHQMDFEWTRSYGRRVQRWQSPMDPSKLAAQRRLKFFAQFHTVLRTDMMDKRMIKIKIMLMTLMNDVCIGLVVNENEINTIGTKFDDTMNVMFGIPCRPRRPWQTKKKKEHGN